MGGVRGVTRRDAAARRSGGERRRTLVGSLGFFTAMGRLLNRPVHRARGTVVDATQLVRERRLGHRERHLARRAARTEASGRLCGRHDSRADATGANQIPAEVFGRAVVARGGGAGVRLAILDAARSAGRRFSQENDFNGARARAAIQPPKPFTPRGRRDSRRTPQRATSRRRGVRRESSPPPHRPVSFSRSERSPSSSRARGSAPVDLHTPPPRSAESQASVPTHRRVEAVAAKASTTSSELSRGGVGVGDQEGVPQARHEVAPRQEPGQQGVRREEVQVCERGVRGAVRSQEKELYDQFGEDGLKDGFGGGGGGFHASNAEDIFAQFFGGGMGGGMGGGHPFGGMGGMREDSAG